MAGIVLLVALVRALDPASAGASPTPSSVPKGGSHVTVAQEIQLGKELAPTVRRLNGGTWQNPAALERIRAMGARLVAVSDRSQVPSLRENYGFELLGTKNINAMAIPGGTTFVTRGLIELGLTDDEMACVLAHEIAHAARRHGAINAETDKDMKARIDSNHKGRFMRLVGRVYTLAYLRKRLDPGLELEADYYGQVYAARAGFNPMGMVRLFERFEKMEKKGRSGLSQRIMVMLFDNHPPTPERIRKARDLADKLNRKETVQTVPVPVYL